MLAAFPGSLPALLGVLVCGALTSGRVDSVLRSTRLGEDVPAPATMSLFGIALLLAGRLGRLK